MPKIVVVVTVASLGRAVVTQSARAGYDVALLSRDPERLDRAAAGMRLLGVRALAIPTDVADADAVEADADKVEAESGRSTSGSKLPSPSCSPPSQT